MKSFQTFLRRCASGTLISLLIFCTGCSQIPFLGSSQPASTTLSMQVEPSGELGVYKISGQTNLPEQTRITIQAVRALKVPGRDPQNAAERSYAILARTQVNIEKGKWQTSLNLLQSGDKGAVETWQRSSQALDLKLQPESEVRFLAVTDPTATPIEFKSSQEKQATSVQFTADGRNYLQTEQLMSIEPPTTKIAAQKPGTTVVNVPVQAVNQANDVKPQSDADMPAKAMMR